MTKRTQQRCHNEQGLILIEAVIAIGVLTIMFAGVLSLFTRSLVGVRESSDQLIATYLAQDAVEYIRAKIAYNIENDSLVPSWSDGVNISNACSDSAPCGVDTTANIGSGSILQSCSAMSGGCVLQLDGATGEYRAGGGSPFSRTIVVTPHDLPARTGSSNTSGNELEVKVSVTWEDGANTGEVPFTFSLYAPD